MSLLVLLTAGPASPPDPRLVSLALYGPLVIAAGWWVGRALQRRAAR